MTKKNIGYAEARNNFFAYMFANKYLLQHVIFLPSHHTNTASNQTNHPHAHSESCHARMTKKFAHVMTPVL